MVDAERLRAVLQAMAGAGERRRVAERKLEGLLLELLDAKVRRGLGEVGRLQELAAVAMGPVAGATATARLMLSRLCYRLAHLAMRDQQWELALELLEAVLSGEADLTRARLYKALCLSKTQGRIPEEALEELLACHRGEGRLDRIAPPLDLLVQDTTTNLLELLLLSQGAHAEQINRLYDPERRHRTTALRLMLCERSGSSATIEMSEWLAQAQLEDYRREGWLVVDSTTRPIGELGRGTPLRSTNFPAKVLAGIAQVLASSAAVPHAGISGLTPDAVQSRLRSLDDGCLIDPDRDLRWEYVTSAVLLDHPDRKVIRRDRRSQSWHLIPPFVVVLRDSATALRQAAGSFQ